MIIDKKETNIFKLHYKELKPGDIFCIIFDPEHRPHHLYMKTDGSKGECVCLSNGYLCHFDKDDIVCPIIGTITISFINEAINYNILQNLYNTNIKKEETNE